MSAPATRLNGLIRPIRLRNEVRLQRPTSWLELFFDLIFVAAVSQLAAPLTEDYSFLGLLRFAFFFSLVWWAWFDHTLFCSRFHLDDGLQRAMTIAEIFVVAVMAANAKGEIASREAAGFGAAFGVMRLIQLLQYLRARRKLHDSHVLDGQLLCLGFAGGLWLLAAVLPFQLRVVHWAAAFTLDTVGPWWRRNHVQRVPPDPIHLPERYGLFTIILLGEFVASLMRGMEAQDAWPVAAFMAASGGFCLAFGCWWIYFEHAEVSEISFSKHIIGDTGKLHRWLYLHLPLYLSLSVTGVGFEHVIRGQHFGIQEASLMFIAFVSLTCLLAFLSRMVPHERNRVGEQMARPSDLVSSYSGL